MSGNNPRLGILLMIATTFVFAMQDGISRHLADAYNVVMIVMIRYWFFAAFVLVLAARQKGGIRATAFTRQPTVQILRGLLLAAEICVTVLSFVYLGLVETHAIFAAYPLMIVALAGPVLKERVGWRRRVAIGVGFVGILIILRPGFAVFSPYALIAVLAALMFAAYGIMTRYVARRDSVLTSFFWTGIAGSVLMTAIGVWFWEPMSAPDMVWMLVLSITGVTGHFLLIKCLEVAEASSVQPFAYFQLVFVSFIGFFIFSETVGLNVIFGALIIVTAGVFAFWRERVREQKLARG